MLNTVKLDIIPKVENCLLDFLTESIPAYQSNGKPADLAGKLHRKEGKLPGRHDFRTEHEVTRKDRVRPAAGR
ncbi:MAG: hypothetical protein R3C24_02540 [Cyanobacteriota/Melainabacteria group bacterium]